MAASSLRCAFSHDLVFLCSSLYEVMGYERPYPGLSDMQIFLALYEKRSPPRPRRICDLHWALCQYCFILIPDQRARAPDIISCLQHLREAAAPGLQLHPTASEEAVMAARDVMHGTSGALSLPGYARGARLLASIMERHGRGSLVQTLLNRAQLLDVALNNPSGEATSAFRLALMFLNRGDLQYALVDLTLAATAQARLDVTANAPDKTLLALRLRCMRSLGRLAYRKMSQPEAIPLLQEAVRILTARSSECYGTPEHKLATAECHYRLGISQSRAKLLPAAATSLQDALTIFSQLSHRKGVAESKLALASVQLALCRPRYATDLLLAAQREFGETNQPLCRAQCLFVLAQHNPKRIPSRLSNRDDSQGFLMEARRLYRDAGIISTAARCLYELAVIHYELADYGSAKARIKEAISESYSISEPSTRALFRYMLGLVERKLTNFDNALKSLKDAWAIYSDVDDAEGMASCDQIIHLCKISGHF